MKQQFLCLFHFIQWDCILNLLNFAIMFPYLSKKNRGSDDIVYCLLLFPVELECSVPFAIQFLQNSIWCFVFKSLPFNFFSYAKSEVHLKKKVFNQGLHHYLVKDDDRGSTLLQRHISLFNNMPVVIFLWVSKPENEKHVRLFYYERMVC